ncbi:hypothetical protein GQR58_018668 [Nymphon striatum]|nr:hypothetical protein GQR58_018668 [Nymphon striatum]
MDDFLASPTLVGLKAFKKTELLIIVKRLKLEAKAAMKKIEIQYLIAEYYCDENIFTETDLTQFQTSIPTCEDLQMKFELEKLQLQCARESEREQRESEREQRESEREQREFELEKLRLSTPTQKTDHVSQFSASREIRLVPPFDENEVDKYFQHFEKVASSLLWPRQHWPLMLQSVIKGKAQQIYSALSTDDASNYSIVKEAILKSYELVPEAYRQRFRNLRKIDDNQTFIEFAHEKEMYFNRWCTSRLVDNDFTKLKELMLIEEFKRCVKDDIKSYLDGNDVLTLRQAAKQADEYALTHKSKFMSNKTPVYNDYNGNKPFAGHGSHNKDKFSYNNHPRNKTPGPVCNFCKKPRHVLSECFTLKRNQRKETLPNAFITKFKKTSPNSNINSQVKKPNSSEMDSLRDEFLPFVSEGFVALNENSPDVPIRILRDTGSSQSILLKSTLNICDDGVTDFSLIQGIEGGIISVPLHTVFLKSNLITGHVKVGLRSELPVKGVSLLLGNDLAGGKVTSSVQVTTQPSFEGDNVELVDIDLFPSCAVTRALAKREIVQNNTLISHDDGDSTASDDNENVQNLSDTLLTTVFEQESNEGFSQSIPPNFDEEGYEDLSFSRDKLISEQVKDSEISELRFKALSDDEIDKFPVGEVVQESLGFSPFELVFGHSVRGPLKIVKEKWLGGDETSVNLLEYVSDFKIRLLNAFEAAQKNLKSSQEDMKS